MQELQCTVTGEAGLHARPALLLKTVVRQYGCSVCIGKNGRFADAGSILRILELGIVQGDTVTVRVEGQAEGPAEAECAETVRRFLEEAVLPVIPAAEMAAGRTYRIAGTGLAGGIAAGRLQFVTGHGREAAADASEQSSTAIRKELTRFNIAAARVRQEQLSLYSDTVGIAGEEAAGIFLFHHALLDADEDLYSRTVRRIRENGESAEEAVAAAFDAQAAVFAAMEDPYFRARQEDITDVRNELLYALETAAETDLSGASVILAADDLSAADIASLDRQSVVGILLRKGSLHSHAAILLRSLRVPVLIRCEGLDDAWEGKTVLIDAGAGVVCLDPAEEFLEAYRQRQQAGAQDPAMVQSADVQKPDVQKTDAQYSTAAAYAGTVRIRANITGPEDLAAVRESGADGIGLFRTEFLYLKYGREPSEEEQFKVYQEILSTLAPLPVTIRTCDAGSDKKIGYLGLDAEENPALGIRGIRISLARQDMFRRQIRALLRASVCGNLSILFPMITGGEEVDQCLEILEECRRELAGEGIPVGEYEAGIMIETPAAVLCADELAEKVSFFSIGTNDLTQYICAADRRNGQAAQYYDERHPAVLRAVQMTAEAARRHHCHLAVCGDLAADPAMAEWFLQAGIEELSADPAAVPALKKALRSAAPAKDTQSQGGS